MDYQEQVENAKLASQKWRKKHPIVGVGELCVDCMVDDLTRSITDLLERAEVAEACCKAFEKIVREYRDEIVPRYMEMAKNAEMERNEAVESICMRCSVLPCRKNECHWYRFKKEE